MSKLEHVNLSVSDPQKTATMLEQVFGWKIRWQGPSQMGGYTIHIGNDDDYIALYGEDEASKPLKNDQRVAGGFNHVGILVDDLDTVEKKVEKVGLRAHSHYDYEPGRRFYFNDDDGVEYEVVSYSENASQ